MEKIGKEVAFVVAIAINHLKINERPQKGHLNYARARKRRQSRIGAEAGT
jgi:hypothetical protein